MRTLCVLSLLTVASTVGCSGTKSGAEFENDGGGSGTTGIGPGGGSSSGGNTSGNSSGGINIGGGNVADGSTGTTTSDGGFVCTPNPLNYDIPNNGCDDDGDGIVDNHITCDTGSVPANLTGAGTAADFAAAIELCHVADATHWGVVSATYTNGYTQTGPGPLQFAQQHGVLTAFGTGGVGPQEGSAFAVLSSGSATVQDSDTGPYFKGGKNGMQGPSEQSLGDVPTGFPAKAGSCPKPAEGVNDVIDVKLQIKVPANANGLSFDFDFYSGEWPEYVCSPYNDSFIAFLTSKAFNNDAPGNISFDNSTPPNPISVNAAFFQVCTPNVATGCSGGNAGTSNCSLGEGQLAGTGFGQENPEQNYCALSGLLGGTGGAPSTSGGATAWLTSQAPVTPGETILLDFLIWDTGDESWDSSVLVDNFFWKPTAKPPPMVVTTPSPPPK